MTFCGGDVIVGGPFIGGRPFFSPVVLFASGGGPFHLEWWLWCCWLRPRLHLDIFELYLVPQLALLLVDA